MSDNAFDVARECLLAAANALERTGSTPTMVLADGRAFPVAELSRPGHWGRLLASLVHGRPRRLDLPLAEARLRLGHGIRGAGGKGKENALIVFRDGEVTRVLKVALFRGNLARDVRMNRTLAAGPGVAPAVLDHDPRFRWALFEYRPAGGGDGRSGGQLFFEAVAPVCYPLWGIRSRPVTAYLRRYGVTLEGINDYLSGLGFPRVAAGATLPFSLVHGGQPERECYLDRQGRPTVLDWEKLHVAPVAYDAMKLGTAGKRAAVDFLEAQRDPDHPAPALQIAVAAATRALASRGKARKYEKLARSVAPLLD